jgi:hypothetical protein
MWQAAIHLNCFLGPVDAHVTTNYPLQSPKRSVVAGSPSAKSVACSRATNAGQTDATLHLCGHTEVGGLAGRLCAAGLRTGVTGRHLPARGEKMSVYERS